MSRRMKVSVGLTAVAMALAVWCLAETTSVSMTIFFTFGLPIYGLAVLLYAIEVVADLRRHRVL